MNNIKELIASGIVAVCDKCDEAWPTIVLTCRSCHRELVKVRQFDTRPHMMPVFWCFPCAQELKHKAWKYEELCK